MKEAFDRLVELNASSGTPLLVPETVDAKMPDSNLEEANRI